MSLLPYALARPFLFGLDPETAHDITMGSIARTQRTPLALAYTQARVHDPVTVAGLQFPNRVGLAAGLDKNARCIDGLGAMGFGFVEVGTVTPLAQLGNPKPRMFRLPEKSALINRLGFNNGGLESFIENVKRSQLHSCLSSKDGANHMILGLNIGKNAATPIENATSDYLTCLTACTRTPTTLPSTSAHPIPKTCVRCKATRLWTDCWVHWPRAVRSWLTNTAQANPCSSKLHPI
jgi:dihydroorotate dehydrogenase